MANLKRLPDESFEDYKERRRKEKIRVERLMRPKRLGTPKRTMRKNKLPSIYSSLSKRNN